MADEHGHYSVTNVSEKKTNLNLGWYLSGIIILTGEYGHPFFKPIAVLT